MTVESRWVGSHLRAKPPLRRTPLAPLRVTRRPVSGPVSYLPQFVQCPLKVSIVYVGAVIASGASSSPGPGLYEPGKQFGRVPDSTRPSAPFTVIGTSQRGDHSPSKTPGPQVC
jgi:hypothetical protein